MFTLHRFCKALVLPVGWLGVFAMGAVTALALCQGEASPVGDKGLEQESVTLPPELAWVPPDAAFFATVRPATLWNCPEGRILREQFPDLAKDIEDGLQRELGLSPGELETLTIVIANWSFLRGERGWDRQLDAMPRDAPRTPPKDKAKEGAQEQPVAAAQVVDAAQPEREGEPALLWIANTTEAATLQRLHKEVQGKSDARKHMDKTYYQSNQPGAEGAVHFVNDRTMVRGPVKHVLKGMEATSTETKGPLVPALRLAKEKHHLALGLQLNDKAAENLLGELSRGQRGTRRALQPLLRARAAAGFADIGKETQAEVQIFFRDGTQAKAGLAAVRMAWPCCASTSSAKRSPAWIPCWKMPRKRGARKRRCSASRSWSNWSPGCGDSARTSAAAACASRHRPRPTWRAWSPRTKTCSRPALAMKK